MRNTALSEMQPDQSKQNKAGQAAAAHEQHSHKL